MARKQWADILYNYVKSNQGCSTREVYEYCYDNWPKTTPMRTSIGTLLSQDKRVRNTNRGKKITRQNGRLRDKKHKIKYIVVEDIT